MSKTLAPILYLPHGGGPLPVLGDPGHATITEFMKTIGPRLETPSAILVVSAHWEATRATIMSAEKPEMLYDYSGFPPEAYTIEYPAPGQPELAAMVQIELAKADLKSDLDPVRGFDHGVFVPLKLIFPEADIPCFQISLIKGLDPAQHIKLGRALNFLREQNVLIVGSGMSFHNMQTFFGGLPESYPDRQFDDWLTKICCSPELTQSERDHELLNWEQAPAARYCHPREEHLLPLHVCYGAAGFDASPAKQVFNDEVLGAKVSAFLWE